jgi:hypothetical protein
LSVPDSRSFLGGLLIAGAGLGLADQAGTASIISSLSLRQQCVASAVNDTTREVGSVLARGHRR